MDKKLYELLNDTENIVLDSDKELITELDKKRMKMNINKKLNTPNPSKKGLLVAAALIICVFGATPALGQMEIAFERIEKHMNSNKELDNYATILDETVTKNGITMKINEVIINNDEIIISSTATADEKLQESGIHYSEAIYINGKRADNGGGGSMWPVNDYSVQSVSTMTLEDIDLAGELNVKVVFSGMNVNDKNKLGKWSFEFKTTGDELKADTKIIALDYSFESEDGQKIVLERLEKNAINTKIYYSSNELGNYDFMLKGHDDLDNEVSFYVAHFSDGKGKFELQFVNGELKKVLPDESKILTLTPYAVAFPKESGKMSDDFKVCGDTFNIYLNK